MSIPEIVIVSIVGIIGFSVFLSSVWIWIDFELSNKKKDEIIYYAEGYKTKSSCNSCAEGRATSAADNYSYAEGYMEVRRLYDKVASLKNEDDIDIIWSK